MDELLKAIRDWVDGFDSDFDALKEAFAKSIRLVEASILRRIIADVLPAIKVEDGAIKTTVGNMAKANLLNRVFDEVGADELRPIVGKLAKDMLEISGKNAAYYYAIGMDKKKVDAIAKDVSLIRSIIGVDSDGKLIRGGYLYNIGRADVVREQIKQFVLSGIAAGQTLTTFKAGLKNLVSGSSQVDGALLSYWDRFAMDAYAQVREVNNLHFAQELGLKWFVYQGGIIKTSRDFCRKKNGKVFSGKEALLEWPKDPDLIDKKTKAQYRPLIDRGRYNCRHFLMWISEERAMEIKESQNGE